MAGVARLRHAAADAVRGRVAGLVAIAAAVGLLVRTRANYSRAVPFLTYGWACSTPPTEWRVFRRPHQAGDQGAYLVGAADMPPLHPDSVEQQTAHCAIKP